MTKPPPDTSWVKMTTLTENGARAAFDRTDRQLARWSLFLGGVALGASVTGLLTWIF